jgi:undecaprenyl-diphosphatase
VTHHLSWLEAGSSARCRAFSELFPVSSLGHAVLVPAWVGGSWAHDLNVSTPESPYLAFIVGLHVATAIALIIYFWRDWLHLVAGFATSIVHREVRTPYQRLAWLLVLATIPVGLVGLLFEHWLRTTLGRPVPAACFLMVNGLLLFLGERLRRRSRRSLTWTSGVRADSDRRVARLSARWRRIGGLSTDLRSCPGHLAVGHRHGHWDAARAVPARMRRASRSSWPLR